MKRNPFSLTDRPLKPSSRKLGKEVRQTAVITDQPTGRQQGWDVSNWAYVVWTCHGVDPDVNDAGASGFTAQIRIWRYKEYSNQGTDTPSGQWFAVEEHTVSMDGDIENGGPMEGVISTDSSDRMYIQVFAVDGDPESWDVALCLYGLADRESGCCEAGSVGGASSSSLPAVTVAHDDPVKDKGLQIMYEATSVQRAAVSTDSDANRPVTNLHGETVLASHTWPTQSDRSEEIDPESEKPVEDVIVNIQDVDADPGASYAPSVDGLPMFGFDSVSFQLYLLGGIGAAAANRTVTVTFEGSDDLEVPAGTRQWVDITPAAYSENRDATSQTYTSTGAVALADLADFDAYNHKRIRVKYDWDADPSATDGKIVVVSRRKVR